MAERHDQTSRRSLLKQAAIGGGAAAVVWSAPTVAGVASSTAAAQTLSCDFSGLSDDCVAVEVGCASVTGAGWPVQCAQIYSFDADDGGCTECDKSVFFRWTLALAATADEAKTLTSCVDDVSLEQEDYGGTGCNLYACRVPFC